MQVELSDAHALQDLSAIWNTMQQERTTVWFPSNVLSWSQLPPLTTLPVWQSSPLPWLCRRPEVRMETQVAQIDPSFLNTSERNDIWSLLSLMSPWSWTGGRLLAKNVYPMLILQWSICGLCLFLEADFLRAFLWLCPCNMTIIRFQ